MTDRAAGATSCRESRRDTAIERAADYLRRKIGPAPPRAVILGSGLGDLANSLHRPILLDYRQIPGFVAPTASGHRGSLLVGALGEAALAGSLAPTGPALAPTGPAAGANLAVLAGRFHRYEGHPIGQVVLPVRVLARWGVGELVVTCAAGGLHPNYRIGDLVAIEGHLDRIGGQQAIWPQFATRQPDARRQPDSCGQPDACGQRGVCGQPGQSAAMAACGVPGRRAEIYDRRWLSRAVRSGRQAGFVVHRGVYLATSGPTYETPAEYRMMRRMGADLVGMSTVPEVIAAADEGLKVLALAFVSNVADVDVPATASHDEVLRAGRDAVWKVNAILRGS